MQKLISDDGLSPVKDFNKLIFNRGILMKKLISNTLKKYFGTSTKKDSSRSESRLKFKLKFIKQHEQQWIIEGAEFRALRESCNLTLRQLSKMTSFSPSRLSRFERGFAVRNSKVLKMMYPLVCNNRVRIGKETHEQFQATSR